MLRKAWVSVLLVAGCFGESEACKVARDDVVGSPAKYDPDPRRGWTDVEVECIDFRSRRDEDLAVLGVSLVWSKVQGGSRLESEPERWRVSFDRFDQGWVVSRRWRDGERDTGADGDTD